MRRVVLICLVFLAIRYTNGEEIESFKAEMQYKSGYHPYLLFGDQPIPDKGVHRSRQASGCPTCIDASSAEPIYIKIKVGSALRFNMIKAFGYILHRRQVEFSTPYYTSLYFILTCIRLNHVDILSLVEALKDAAFLAPSKLYLKVFEEMENHLPTYLRCAASFWVEAIKSKKVDLDAIIMPFNDDTVVVNLLEGISPEELRKASDDGKLEKVPVGAEKKIVYNFNINMLHLIRYLDQQKKFTPYQWLIAGILEFFPRALIQPDLEESIEIMVQYLYQNPIKELRGIDVPKEQREPYKLIQYIFGIITKSPDVVDVIKESAYTILRNLRPRTPTAVNQNYRSFTFFVQPGHIKTIEMLDYVKMGSFPVEIRAAAMRVQYYIHNGDIGYTSTMMGFNPYLYSNPTEVLLAMLDRILRRQPELKPEVRNSIGAVYSYLIFKYRYLSMPVTYPTDLANINVMLMAFRAPDIDPKVRNQVDFLIDMIEKNETGYLDILRDKLPVYHCPTPVICLTKLLLLIKDCKINIATETDIKVIVEVTESGCQLGKCPVVDQPDNEILPNKTWYDFFRRTLSTYHENATTLATSPPPTLPKEDSIRTEATKPSTAATTPTPPPPPPEVTTVNPIWTQAPTALATAFLKLMNDSKTELKGQDKFIAKLNALLEKDEYKKLLVNMQEQHDVLITTYLSFLDMVGTKENATSDASFKDWLMTYRKKASVTLHEVEKIHVEAHYKKPVPVRLMIALPAPKGPKEQKLFATLTKVLLRDDVYEAIYTAIKKEKEVNVGVYLEALLTETLKLTKKLSKEEMEAVRYYKDKVQKHGLGESKIEYGVSTSVVSEQINISGCMNDALKFDSLDKDSKKAFNDIILYLKGNTALLSRWSKWVFHPTATDFSRALFHYILDDQRAPLKVIKAVKLLLPKLKAKKGTGQQVCIRHK